MQASILPIKIQYASFRAIITVKENAMEWMLIVKAILSLAFVLGLLLLVLWLLKYCELHGEIGRAHV